MLICWYPNINSGNNIRITDVNNSYNNDIYDNNDDDVSINYYKHDNDNEYYKERSGYDYYGK